MLKGETVSAQHETRTRVQIAGDIAHAHAAKDAEAAARIRKIDADETAMAQRNRERVALWNERQTNARRRFHTRAQCGLKAVLDFASSEAI